MATTGTAVRVQEVGEGDPVLVIPDAGHLFWLHDLRLIAAGTAAFTVDAAAHAESRNSRRQAR
ncbi:MAG TPA: hypothetical protein VLB67_06190 [Acidimicrobiia bacterium]|nr:hypothetical protein [Acidimicrobiia bacterium]